MEAELLQSRKEKPLESEWKPEYKSQIHTEIEVKINIFAVTECFVIISHFRFPLIAMPNGSRFSISEENKQCFVFIQGLRAWLEVGAKDGVSHGDYIVFFYVCHFRDFLRFYVTIS